MYEFDVSRENLKHLNILIIGKTGVGKSTLVNSMFGESMADTGFGKSVTATIQKYEKTGSALAIFDTPGFELGGSNNISELLTEIKALIRDRLQCCDCDNISPAIHAIWYCINSNSQRFEQAEIDFLKQLLTENSKYHIPVIIVLTQSFSKSTTSKLMESIKSEYLPVADIIPVLAKDYEIDDDCVISSYGLDRLAEATNRIIPEAVRCAQKAERKENRAAYIVAGTAVALGLPIILPIAF